ncbi:hypothetical protein RJ639_035868 [Escallonia herrerae]|uniref:DUF4283 domain-containing protein n=1 Tax=Escallonia herrerae TaxID=1293975 RepID=A0AA88WQ89_9ASTE|nr:hypothetical protein RJ639_035868 [Escallonia herrerae]
MQPHNHHEINDLIAQTNRLKCSLEPLSLESDPDVPNPSTPSILVGKIINDKLLNRTGVKNTILKAWNPPSGLKIREQDDRLLFTFNNSQDLQRILDRRPWWPLSSLELGVDLEIVSASANLINGLVFSDPTDTPWMLTAIYGLPYRHQKPLFWNNLSKMINSFAGPWLGIGDFNEILAISDKRGGRPYASPSHGGFPSVMLEKGLVDLGFSGNPFTWTNKQPLQANIRERLDRGLGNPQWCILFPNATIKHLSAILSDHNPISFNTAGSNQSGPKPFKFSGISSFHTLSKNKEH